MSVQVRGLNELRRELRGVNPKLTKTFTVANKTVSEKIVALAQPKVAGLPSPGGSIAAGGIRARSTQQSARVVLLGSNPTVRANVFGTLSHVAWGHKKSGSKPWLPWVGRTWTPEDLHGVGPAFTQVADTFAPVQYADALMKALKSAFPN